MDIEGLREAVRGRVEALGAELVDLNLRRSGSRSILTVVADKASGITLDDCAEINKDLSRFFDAETGFDFTLGPYFLEVNSPGLDRPLKTARDFERVGEESVRVTLREADGRTRSVTGKIVSVKEEAIALKENGRKGQLIMIPLASIARAVREIRI